MKKSQLPHNVMISRGTRCTNPLREICLFPTLDKISHPELFTVLSQCLPPLQSLFTLCHFQNEMKVKWSYWTWSLGVFFKQTPVTPSPPHKSTALNIRYEVISTWDKLFKLRFVSIPPSSLFFLSPGWYSAVISVGIGVRLTMDHRKWQDIRKEAKYWSDLTEIPNTKWRNRSEYLHWEGSGAIADPCGTFRSEIQALCKALSSR